MNTAGARIDTFTGVTSAPKYVIFDLVYYCIHVLLSPVSGSQLVHCPPKAQMDSYSTMGVKSA